MSSVGILGGQEPATLQQRVHGAARPPTWHLDKLHRVLRVRRGIKNNGMKEDNLLSLSYGRIIPKDINTSEGLLPENFEGYQIVEPGNIVMRLTDLQNDKRSLRQGLVKERGIITSAYDALNVPKGQCPEFWFYSLLALDLAKHYYSLGGGVRQSVKFSDFPNDWIYLPDLTTQRQIADFLDRETARIDRLIEKKLRMMTALGDSRNAVLLKAVTCGLDGQAAMKATETSWLPQIPAHWTIQRMKFLGQAIIGLTYAPEDLVEEGDGTPVLRANNIQSGKLVRDDIVYVTTTIPKKLWLRHGDILICSRNGSRNLIGKNGVVSGEFVGMTFGAFNTVFRSKHHRFLYWVLQSPVFAYQAGAFLTSTINQLTVSTLSNLSVPFPPAVEQNSISDYLDAQEIEFDRLVKTIKMRTAVQNSATVAAG